MLPETVKQKGAELPPRRLRRLHQTRLDEVFEEALGKVLSVLGGMPFAPGKGVEWIPVRPTQVRQGRVGVGRASVAGGEHDAPVRRGERPGGPLGRGCRHGNREESAPRWDDGRRCSGGVPGSRESSAGASPDNERPVLGRNDSVEPRNTRNARMGKPRPNSIGKAEPGGSIPLPSFPCQLLPASPCLAEGGLFPRSPDLRRARASKTDRGEAPAEPGQDREDSGSAAASP